MEAHPQGVKITIRRMVAGLPMFPRVVSKVKTFEDLQVKVKQEFWLGYNPQDFEYEKGILGDNDHPKQIND